MIYRIADNVLSPLGTTTQENYQAVKSGRSALCRYENHWGLPEAFTASLFTEDQTQQMAIDGLTRFESLAARSAQEAIRQSGIDIATPRTVFILSTTKANVELLAAGADVSPATAAQHVARYLGFTTEPIAVCNACISGVSAIVLALRLLDAGRYDYAVVCGADVQNPFTVSGFQSLKAVAEDACRPFDIERLGLNLGEAAATIVFQRNRKDGCWAVEQGAVRNDGYHISTPSRNGEGARLCLTAIHADAVSDGLAFINAHGTATMFNDQMESVAIERAGLQSVPVNAYKGYFGHTLGAAGVLETVLSMAAADDHTVLATRGYAERGVSGKIQLSAVHAATDQQRFVKMISGFGGCNGAILVSKSPALAEQAAGAVPSVQLTHRLRLTPDSLTVDGEVQPVAVEGRELLTHLYKQYIGDYPKYYKMDGLSRLGFVAAELLLKQDTTEQGGQHTAVILFNHSSSIAADRKYLESIAEQDNFFPSPSVFVYTLPNIVTGEIAIRHQYNGETSFYVLPQRDDELMMSITKASLADPATRRVLGGWIDYADDTHFEADLYILAQ